MAVDDAADLDTHVVDGPYTLEILKDRERRRIDARRELYGEDVSASRTYAGLALSGGGIRSATFSLGILRELAALKILHRFDYLSTVSGGSYIGSYYCGLFAPRRPDGQTDTKTDAVLTAKSFGGAAAIVDPFGVETGDARRSLNWLRQSGRYLAPSGSGDIWHAIGMLVRNWIGLHLVIGTSIMLIALLFGVGARLAYYRWGAELPLFTGREWLRFAPLAVLLAIPIACHVACGWAYWLTTRDVNRPRKWRYASTGGTVIIALGALLWALNPGEFRSPEGNVVPAAVVGLFALAALILVGLCYALAYRAAGAEQRWDECRTRLTRPMRWCMQWVVILSVAAAIDALSFQAYRALLSELFVFGLPAIAASVLAGRRLVARLSLLVGSIPGQKGADEQPPKRSLISKDRLLTWVAALAAILLLVLVVLIWAVLAYLAAWPTDDLMVREFHSGCPLQDRITFEREVWLGCGGRNWAAIWLQWGAWSAGLALLAGCIAATPEFLNLSGLTAFYASRLRRAYLGAGNPPRLAEDVVVDKGEGGDEVWLEDYYPPVPEAALAAPLHLINITLNETRSSGSNIVQRDRRGRNLVVSPDGIYCTASRGKALYRIAFDRDRHEMLPLSSWIAISGAAFSTGLGSRTGFPLSQLAGLANVRLGYWWRARTEGTGNPTQYDLFREFRGDYSGPDEKYWYLSDGGHFENTGVYELIRRQVPFILVSDNGMDERYEYEDIANLVRKARIDFNCEINFANAATLDARLGKSSAVRRRFGTLDQIAGGIGKDDLVVAALAALRYETPGGGDHYGTMVLIKPRLTGDGPADLFRYKAANAAFPHQTTLDQFFDEAQWESYYHLGRLIAQGIFGAEAPKWRPDSLDSAF